MGCQHGVDGSDHLIVRQASRIAITNVRQREVS